MEDGGFGGRFGRFAYNVILNHVIEGQVRVVVVVVVVVG